MRNRFHSICPYFAMFPEQFAEQWIERLTSRGDVVLDPFSGRGTTAFQSLLMDRRAVACDVNDVAFCLTRAKTAAPAKASVRARLSALEEGYRNKPWIEIAKKYPPFFKHAFAVSTLAQLLYLRSNLRWQQYRTDAMLAALVLGTLHGDRSPTYLSNQMPRTISTKPAYSIRFWHRLGLQPPARDAFEVIKAAANYRYVSDPPQGSAVVLHCDMRKLPWVKSDLLRPVRCVITSPPYFDVTSFEEDQWLRLWFLGGPTEPTYRRISRDDRYSFEPSYWAFIADMWRSLAKVVARNANVVIRIGSSRLSPHRLAKTLHATSRVAGRKVQLVSIDVSEIRGRQTDAFRPGSRGCRVEVDCHFRMR